MINFIPEAIRVNADYSEQLFYKSLREIIVVNNYLAIALVCC